MQKDLELFKKQIDQYITAYQEDCKKYLIKYEENIKRLTALAENARALSYPDSWEVIGRDQSYFRVKIDGARIEFCITTFTVSISYNDNVHAVQYSNKHVKNFDDTSEMMQLLINAFLSDLDRFKTLERLILMHYHSLW